MTFDIHVHAFRDGHDAPLGAAAEALLLPHVAQRGGSWAVLELPDGRAHVHGLGQGSLLVTDMGGDDVVALVLRVAREAHAVLAPSGGALLIASDGTRAHLPPELRAEAVTVGDVEEFWAALN